METNTMSMETSLHTWWREIAGADAALAIVGTPMRGLFEVSPASGVTISTDQADGIALFAGISTEQYLKGCAIAGLTQWRALDLNPMLVVEDFAHTEPRDCIFVQRPSKAEYALAFESPSICFGCFEFYHCLGADREIAAARSFVRSLQRVMPGSHPVPVLR